MANTSPLAPKLLKGALIRLDETGIGPVPQVIVFQYNPESLSRKLKRAEAKQDKEASKTGNPGDTAQPADPEEEFDLALELDATDDLEEPLKHPVAMAAGVADRIAALEMLLYPADEVGLLSSVVASLAGSLGLGATASIPDRRETPVVLLVWGPGRILPVKIDAVSVEEQAFNPALYPIRAKVTVSVKVLTEDYFDARITDKTPLRPAEEIARSAYRYTLKQKKKLAAANVLNSLDSVLSLLPF
jgi:hypothetical protein